MTDNLVTLTPQEHAEELDRAYARGRVDERKHLQERGLAITSAADARHTMMERYLKARGWAISGNKANGTEWVDNSKTVRIGIPHQLTTAAWKQFVHTLAAYYRKSETDIANEIKMYRSN